MVIDCFDCEVSPAAGKAPAHSHCAYKTDGRSDAIVILKRLHGDAICNPLAARLGSQCLNRKRVKERHGRVVVVIEDDVACEHCVRVGSEVFSMVVW
jgi:hypothetical protein